MFGIEILNKESRVPLLCAAFALVRIDSGELCSASTVHFLFLDLVSFTMVLYAAAKRCSRGECTRVQVRTANIMDCDFCPCAHGGVILDFGVSDFAGGANDAWELLGIDVGDAGGVRIGFLALMLSWLGGGCSWCGSVWSSVWRAVCGAWTRRCQFA